MRRVHLLAKRAALSNINVLIVGETGVGKEVLAEIIHGLSPRAQRPFVRINCATLSPSLFEAELFGHERAAFTDAREAKPGLLETAEKGTVLLDEIGELPLPLQAKLLRVIETREVMRVGAVKPRTVDVRFLAATNRVLEDEVARGAFRQDLYYRLNGISLLIPPLRARVDEIEPLARSFAEAAARLSDRAVPKLSPAAVKLLLSYPWPGNIRELRNTIERALLLSGGDAINPEDLPLEKMRGTPVSLERVPETLARTAQSFSVTALDEESRLDYERIIESLSLCSGNQTRAAKLLGMSRRTFCARLKAYNIPRPRVNGNS
jgi:transcriptional regulator with PAS, ATPase and Fis domain